MSISAAQVSQLVQGVKRDPLQQNDGAQVSMTPAGLFSKRLDAVLERNAATGSISREQAQQTAELLQLSSMRSSLALLSPETADDNAAAPLLSQTLSSLQAYLEVQGNTSTGNQASTGERLVAAAEPVVGPSDTVRPVERQERQTSGQAAFSRLDQLIERASRRYGVESGLVRAVIKAESNFNPRAVSAAGAQGLMQLMPATAKGLGVTDAFDPEQNVMAGTRFLKSLLDRYEGNLDAALAAYNWGPGNVDRKPERLPRETRDYLAKVKQYYSSELA